MKTTWKKIMAGILTTTLCMQSLALEGGLSEVQAKTQDVYGMDGIFLAEGGWYCVDSMYSLEGEDEFYDGIKICGYEGEEKELIIPEKIDGKVVWGIERSAFMDSDIRSIQMPETVVDIAMQAFSGCEELESVTVYECEEKMNFSEICQNVLGPEAFCGCKNLKSLTISKGIEMICSSAFSGCESLKEIVIPKGVTEIYGNAFENCKSLEHIVIPDGVEEIEYNTFEGCESLKSVQLPLNLTHIGDEAFKGCVSLESIEIPGGVKEPKREAFSGCTSLKEVVILSGVEEIREDLFKNCTSLENITIPATVHKISYWAFDEYENLTIHTTNATTAHHYAQEHEIKCVVEDHVGDVYTTQDGWQYKELDNGIEVVYYTGTEEQIDIPETIEGKTVTALGNMTFFPWDEGEDYRITGISIPESVTSIGDSAFRNCCALENIVLPKNISYIGNEAFRNCYKLQEIVIPKSLQRIESYTFYNCEGLKTVEIQEGEKKVIKHNAFGYCSQLEKVYMYWKTGTIDREAFANCGKYTIYTYLDTEGMYYAKIRDIPYVILPNPEEDNDEITVTPTAVPTITGGEVSPSEPTVTEVPDKPSEPTVMVTPMATPTALLTKAPVKVKAPKVKKVSGLKASPKKKALAISWKKLSGIDGYQLQVSTKKNFKGAKTININKSKKKYTASKLKSKKKYYVRIRGYKNYKLANGKKTKACGTWKVVSKKTK